MLSWKIAVKMCRAEKVSLSRAAGVALSFNRRIKEAGYRNCDAMSPLN